MRRTFALFCSLLVAAPALAQQPAPRGGEELVDRVVAVVGDTVLLLSDVQGELQQLQASGQPLPEDPSQRAALVSELVDARVNDLVLLQAAKNAGVQVRDEEVTEMVEQDLRSVQQRFQSEEAFRSALAESGMTVEQYRQSLADQYRNRMLTQRFVQQRLSTAARPAVTEEEIRRFFDAQASALGTRPATVSFQQVIVPVTASEEARAEARRTGEQVLQELRDGASFEVLARRYSADPGSRDHGGDLGWFRRGRMVPAFEEVAFRLRPGETSGLVETDFGYHIIRLERVRGGERHARHILIRPEVAEADEQRAYERADSIAAAAREGASFTELVRRYPTPGENRVEHAPLDRLPPVYARVLEEAQPGAVVGPFEIPGPTGGPRWVVVRLNERVAEGAFTVNDVREQIRERIQEQKMLEQIVTDLRRGIYVNVTL